MAELLELATVERDHAVTRAAETLRRSELVVLPTDTVYGVAADAFDRDATARVFAAKERARRFPLPVLVRSPKQLAGLSTRVPETAERLMAAYWPGPLTIVITAEPNLRWDLGTNEGTVAVRMPLDDVALEVIRAVGPLAVTSANRSGRAPAPPAAGARDQLGDAVALYLDDGPRTDGQASTIVDLTRREPHVLRTGQRASDEVLAVARGELDPTEVSLEADDEEPGAPG